MAKYSIGWLKLALFSIRLTVMVSTFNEPHMMARDGIGWHVMA